MSIDWQTWSPFQSPEVREICRHLSVPERAGAMLRSALYGLWVGVTVSVPVMAVLGSVIIPVPWGQTPLIRIAGSLFLLHLVCIPLWQRSMRRFLCATAWATKQGFTPERLKLFGKGSGKAKLSVDDSLE